MAWWNELTQLQQGLAYIAIPSTLIMLLQFILSLFGFGQGDGSDVLDGDGDFGGADGDFDFDDASVGDAFGDQPGDVFDHEDVITDGTADGQDGAEVLKLFSIRGIIAFLAVGGWTGIVALDYDIPNPAALGLAFVAGWLALYFVAWSIKFALGLQQRGNIIINNAIGTVGEVYIPIPSLKKGKGKINVVIQERLTEVDAMTDVERVIKTGEKVTVMGVEAEGILLVVPQENTPQGVNIDNEI